MWLPSNIFQIIPGRLKKCLCDLLYLLGNLNPTKFKAGFCHSNFSEVQLSSKKNLHRDVLRTLSETAKLECFRKLLKASELTIKSSERCHWRRSSVFFVNFEAVGYFHKRQGPEYGSSPSILRWEQKPLIIIKYVYSSTELTILLLPFTEPAARQIVRISIDDENDNPPHFMQPLFSGGMEHPGSNFNNVIIKFIFKKYSKPSRRTTSQRMRFLWNLQKKRLHNCYFDTFGDVFWYIYFEHLTWWYASEATLQKAFEEVNFKNAFRAFANIYDGAFCKNS